MRGVAGFTLFRCWHDDVRYLNRCRLTGQRKHLIHSDPGPDRCVAQAGFANRFLHTTGAQLRNVREDPDDAPFSLAYLRSFDSCRTTAPDADRPPPAFASIT